MKCLISGHRIKKLANYDLHFIQCTLYSVLAGRDVIGLSGMADGIDLMFCETLLEQNKGYHCYIPFEGQDAYMSQGDVHRRDRLIRLAWKVYNRRNSAMVESCDTGIIVWDGNKGGTHNVFQQMIEAGKPFTWIDPVNQRVIEV